MKNINPNSLQGKDRINKMRNLMGKMTLNENKVPTTKVELTKLGPDNLVYGIVKENHEYYIKTTNKIKDVMVEDFQYIGGLGNKKQYAFESYSKALKKLNLKMISLNEQYEGDKVNVFENDHLIVGGDADTSDESFEEFVEETVVEEGELNVGTVVTDGPKELDGNTVGDFEDSKVEPDDAPNDNSTGTEKMGAEKATPKKTIKETRKRLSILDALERFDGIVESVINKKKTLNETKYKLKVDDPSPEPEPQGVNSGEASFNEPAVEPEAEPMPEPMGDAPSDKPFDDTPFDAGVEADEDSEPKKYIQQLSGKLGQSLRSYTQDVGMDLDLEKFAINSLLSATHTSEMDPEDQKDIIKRIETSGDEPEEEENLEEPAPEMDGAEITGASNPSSAPAPMGGGPMGESFEVLDKEHKQVFKDAKLGVTESQFDNPDDDFMSIDDLERIGREIEHGVHSHDMIESDEENKEIALSINDKKDSFVDSSIRQMMDDYLNTQHGFEEPETQPLTRPQVLPETKPRVPRRSRPYRVNPNPNPTPKGKL